MSKSDANGLDLVYAEYFRDGGSLGACFRRPDGSLLHVFLQVIWPERPGEQPGERYRELYLGDSEDLPSAVPEFLVARGGPIEAEILRQLGGWLEANGAADGSDHVRNLLARIPKREG